MSRVAIIHFLLGALAGIAGLVWMNSLAKLQLPSVLLYSGIIMAGYGVILFLLPGSWSPFRARFHGLVFGAGLGILLIAAGWFWPLRVHFAATSYRIDAFMPQYDFGERHEILVRASMPLVRQSFERVTFADIQVMQRLGRIRSIAMGRLKAPSPPAAAPALPIVEMIRRSRTAFFCLDDSADEFVFGLAGQPWNNRGLRLEPREFREWAEPGNVKVAANFLIEDAGSGLTRITTETRVLATNDAARQKMSHYWALIYPGSGMIRQSLLSAIRDRAEAR